jgi:hypothetical protein
MHENRETSGAPRPEKGTRPVCEGAKPQGSRARSGGVGPRHSIDEPDERRRAISGGVWGEKGAGQGEHRSTQHQPDTARGNRVCQGLSGVRVATLLVTHPRWEPYAGKPLVRFCAGGDQRWSSLPQQLIVIGYRQASICHSNVLTKAQKCADAGITVDPKGLPFVLASS